MTNSMIMFLEASAAKSLVSNPGLVTGPTGTGFKVTIKSNERRYICACGLDHGFDLTDQ